MANLDDIDIPLFEASKIANMLGIRDINSTIRNYTLEFKVTQKTKTKGGDQLKSFLTKRGLQRLLVSSRKECPKELLNIIGVQEIRVIPEETDFIANIVKAFKEVEITLQYAVGKYRIDAYLPKYKIAIEYDERAHEGQVNEDRMRQEYIEEKLDCMFIRAKFNGNIFDTISEMREWINRYEFDELNEVIQEQKGEIKELNETISYLEKSCDCEI